MDNWYQQDATAVAEALKSSQSEGLTTQMAQAKLDEFGLNELEEKGAKSVWAILWEQLTDVMVMILIVAAIVSAFIGEPTDTVVIIAIVILNALLGVTQEYRAEQAIAALKKLAVPTVRVRRNGQTAEISARELVPGDVVLLESGNLVPADGRVLASNGLRVEEAALTGESEPVEKRIDPIEGEDVPLGDRKNYVYMGTTVVYGRGEVMITETGMQTELGNIANLLQSVEDEQTPLQKRLDGLGKTLAIIAGLIILVVFVLGVVTSEEVSELSVEGAGVMAYLQSEDVQELFLTAISMAVAAIPEGLPAVVTIALALGSQRLLKRNSLIRKLPAVETLGSVTVICSDKTGTLTENKMTVTFLDVAGDREQVEHLLDSDAEYELADLERQADAPAPKRSLAMLLKAGAHCNDGELTTNDEGETVAIGDPTETALIVAADKFGLHKKELDEHCPRVAEVPFSSARKRMTTVHVVSDESHDSESPWADTKYVAFTKGAVDNLLELTSHVWMGSKAVQMDGNLRQRIEDANAELAQTGHRVLGAAYRPIDDLPDETERIENELTFIGFAGIIDPPRGEVKPAVAECRTAGIRPIMITGDHPLTAQYIAKDLDIARNEQVYTGQKLNKTSDSELKQVIEDVSVFARVAPEHKLNIVDALQEKGEIVAMTGDGVNDAPALKKANIGVAMGITGTDVSKEAADMVLLDDNFATIVAAVKEGRTVYDNIRKFIKYTLSSNTGELLVMLIAPFLGMPLPLIPIQILWINLVTDGVPGLALAVEQSERGTMKRPPFHPKESIFSRGMGGEILAFGLIMGLVSFLVGYWGFVNGRDLETWRTMVFTTLTIAQMGNALAIRSNQDSIFSIGLFSNMVMVYAIAGTFALQMLLIYVPFLQGIFDTTALSAVELVISLVASSAVFMAVEGWKGVKRAREG